MSNNILPCSPIYPQNTIPHTPSQADASAFLQALQKAEQNTQQQNFQKETQDKKALEE